jgi:hypothetical protein
VRDYPDRDFSIFVTKLIRSTGLQPCLALGAMQKTKPGEPGFAVFAFWCFLV